MAQSPQRLSLYIVLPSLHTPTNTEMPLSPLRAPPWIHFMKLVDFYSYRIPRKGSQSHRHDDLREMSAQSRALRASVGKEGRRLPCTRPASRLGWVVRRFKFEFEFRLCSQLAESPGLGPAVWDEAGPDPHPHHCLCSVHHHLGISGQVGGRTHGAHGRWRKDLERVFDSIFTCTY